MEYFYQDSNESIKKVFRYLVIAFVVGLVAKWISTKKLTIQEILIISLTSSLTLLLLDVYSPIIVSSDGKEGVVV